MMRHILLLLLVLFSSTFLNTMIVKADNDGVALDLGYKFNRRSIGYLGASFTAFNKKDFMSFSLGGGVNVGKFGTKSQFFPSGYVSFTKIIFELGAEGSPHYVAPYIGLNGLSFAKMRFGYSIPAQSLKGVKMKGFFFSLIFSFGTRGYYMDLSN